MCSMDRKRITLEQIRAEIKAEIKRLGYANIRKFAFDVAKSRKINKSSITISNTIYDSKTVNFPTLKSIYSYLELGELNIDPLKNHKKGSDIWYIFH